MARWRTWWRRANLEQFLSFAVIARAVDHRLLADRLLDRVRQPGPAGRERLRLHLARGRRARRAGRRLVRHAVPRDRHGQPVRRGAGDRRLRLAPRRGRRPGRLHAGSARWTESRIYFTVVWTMVIFGTAILLAGFDQPLVLVTISTVLGGVIMFVYSCLLVVTNRRYLPEELKLRGYRLAIIAFAILLLGVTSTIVGRRPVREPVLSALDRHGLPERHARGQAGGGRGRRLRRGRAVRARPRRLAARARGGARARRRRSASRSGSTSRSATSRRCRRSSCARTCAARSASSRVMEQLGADLLLVCSNVSERGDRRRRARRRPAPRAGRARRRARHPHRLRGARLGPPRARLRPRLADRRGRRPPEPRHLPRLVPHPLPRRRPARASATIPGEKIFYLQLADAPQLVMDVLQWSRHYRCFPGQGGFDLAGVPRARARDRLRGPLSLEVFNDVFRQADPRADGRRRDALAAAARGGGRRDGRCRPPRRCAATRSSSWRSRRRRAAGVERLLIAMGFRHAGHHRTQGRPALAPRATRTSSSTTSTRPRRARGWRRSRSRAPTRSARRSAPSGCSRPLLPRDRGPDEADLSAIAAPDGTSVFFCRTDAADADSWLADFLTAGPPGGRACRRGRRHRPRRALAAVRLLRRGRAVLPLGARAGARRPAHELAAPDGLVRSRAARSARRQRPLRAQRAARRQRRLGAPARRARLRRHLRRRARDARPRRAAARHPRQLLRRPRGPHRTSTPATIERMRALGVLYDADGGGGELLHFYTAMVGPEPVLRGASSAAAATTATAPPTRPCGWPHTSWALRSRTQRSAYRSRALAVEPMATTHQSSPPRPRHPRREAGPQSHGTPPEFAGLPKDCHHADRSHQRSVATKERRRGCSP